ncbi:MAG: amino acid ABC transporter permease [Bacilli bacterium]|nr:amino acid ABC transporter permease [Bacilli bacterium]
MGPTLDILSQLGNGFLYTILLFVITLVLSIPLGMIIYLLAKSKFKPLSYLFKGIIWVIRGTPLMLQILLVSFLPMLLFNAMNKEIASFFNITISQLLFVFVSIAFVFNYACYFAEIYRAGFESINKGQYEAAKVLNLTKSETFFKIILPQVIKRIVPPMSNEVITLVKDTSLAQILGVVELLSSANHAVNQYVVLTPLLYAGAFYLIFTFILTVLLTKLEKKLSYYEV